MIKCANCGKELKDDAKFCTGCGTPVAVVEAVEAVEEKVEEVVDTAKKETKKAKKKVEEKVVEVKEEVKEKAAEVKEEVKEAVSAPVVPPVAPPAKPTPAKPVETSPEFVPVPAPAPAHAPTPTRLEIAESALPKRLKPLTTGQWMFMMFIMAIPVVGWLYTLICALLNKINRARRNYCRAVIYWFLIGLLIMIVVGLVGYFWAWPKYGPMLMEYLQNLAGQLPTA